MVPEHEHRSLLHALQQLYSRVVFRVLHGRIGSYRERAGSKSGHDLATPLADDIERLAASERAHPRVTPRKLSWRRRPMTGQEHEPGSSYPGQPVSIVNRALGGLARYFKIRRNHSVMDPQMSEKLKKSTWNHIHTALRLARQGEVRTARLHADIANHALHEAGHYMSEQEYTEFTLEVEDKLSEIRKQDS